MDRKTYITLTSALLGIVALVHLARVIFGWETVVDGWAVPLWVSWAALIIAGYLSYAGFYKLTK